MKQILKKVNLVAFAPLLVAVAMAFMPALAVSTVPQVADAQLINDIANNCPEGTGVRCSEGSIVEIFRLVLNWALAIAFLIAVIFLIYGGFQYIFAGGNDDAAGKGSKTITNALIGLVIIVLSFIIVQIVYRFVSGSGSSALGT
ncbi:MAG: pilin [Candidatus Doudnabacteria bacterium]